MPFDPVSSSSSQSAAPRIRLRLPDREILFPRRPLIMGILNLNDDSFSGDGNTDPEWALGRIQTMAKQGADCIDLGAESARTNRPAISVQEEIDRLGPVLAGWNKAVAAARPRDQHQIFPPVLSVNTWRPEVATAAVAAGAELLNDMSGLADDCNARICAGVGCALLIMHTVGQPKQDHCHVRHPDILRTLHQFFAQRMAGAAAAGLAVEQVVLDPGLGFAKPPADDLRICRELKSLQSLGRPLLLPIGRKGVIGHVLNLDNPADRDAGTIACIAFCAGRGAGIFRVHCVDQAWLALKAVEGVCQWGSLSGPVGGLPEGGRAPD